MQGVRSAAPPSPSWEEVIPITERGVFSLLNSYMSWLTVLTFATKLVKGEVLACYQLRAYSSAMVLAQNSFAQPNFIYRHNRGKWRETGDGQRSRDANGPPQRSALKGQCQENFYFRLFLMNHLPLCPL
jgi:hypothetical protein